jgi:hypothetical protein
MKQSALGREHLPAVIEDKHAAKSGLGHAAYGEKMSAEGKKMIAAGDRLKKRVDKIEGAKAESAIYQEAIKIGAAVEEEYKDRPGEMQGEYEKRMGAAWGKIGAGISNPENRVMSDAKYSDLLARGSERTRLKAKSRGHEINAANLIRNVRNNLTAAIAMDDPLMQGHVFTTMQNWITQAVNNGDITMRSGLIMGEKFINDFATGFYETSEPHAALKAITDAKVMVKDKDGKPTGRIRYKKTGTWLDHIPPQDIGKIERTIRSRLTADRTANDAALKKHRNNLENSLMYEVDPVKRQKTIDLLVTLGMDATDTMKWRELNAKAGHGSLFDNHAKVANLRLGIMFGETTFDDIKNAARDGHLTIPTTEALTKEYKVSQDAKTRKAAQTIRDSFGIVKDSNSPTNRKGDAKINAQAGAALVKLHNRVLEDPNADPNVIARELVKGGMDAWRKNARADLETTLKMYGQNVPGFDSDDPAGSLQRAVKSGELSRKELGHAQMLMSKIRKAVINGVIEPKAVPLPGMGE